MSAALALMVAGLAAATPGADGLQAARVGPFRVYQYRSDAKTETVNFRKGLSCLLEASTSRTFAEYAAQRWSDEEKIILIQPKNGFQSACAFPGFDPKTGAPKNLPKFRIAAVALGAPDSAELFKNSGPFPAYEGWPAPPGTERKKSSKALAPSAGQRLGVVCWPGEERDAWPSRARAAAGSADAGPSSAASGAAIAHLDQNRCELWLLPVASSASGEIEAKLGAESLLVAAGPIPFAKLGWSGSLDEAGTIALDFGRGVAVAASAPDAGIAAPEPVVAMMPDAGAAPAAGTPAPAPIDVPPAPKPARELAACDARQYVGGRDYRAQIFARFSEWARRLDLEVTVTGDGHITAGELDVARRQKLNILRAALERRLDCFVLLDGETLEDRKS